MHYFRKTLSLAAVVSLFPFPGLSSPAENATGNPATALKPINVLDFEAATGIQRRAAEDFSHLDPTTQAELIYGRSGKDGQLLLANMTLYAPDGLQIVMMERFEPLTSAVDCKGDDGHMSLTFKSKDAFKHALDTWTFINQAPEKKFLLIANHDGCGPDDERQPYLITKVQENEATLTTNLTAQKAPWSEIAGSYDLDFGRAIPTNKTIERRGFFDILSGDSDTSKSASFPLSVGTPGVTTAIVSTSVSVPLPLGLHTATDKLYSFSLSCLDCYVTGSFEVTGHLSVHDYHLQDFTLSGTPQDFAAKLMLGTTIAAPYSPDSLSYNKTLFSAPIPDAGISVTGIFSLGAIVSYDIGVSTTFRGSASMIFGLTASLPNTAVAIADIQNPTQSSATGFDGGSFDPSFNLTALSASVTVAAFSQPKLSFGVDITGIGHLDVALALKLPLVEATVAAAYNESGLCSTDPGASKTGAKVTTDVAVEVDLLLDAKLGSDTTPSASFVLFNAKKDLSSNCFPIPIPGLTSSNSTNTAITATPTLPTTAIDGVTSVPVTVIGVPTVTPVTTVAVKARGWSA
ncbi:MAG: hypothetical protein Q9194_006308 [Teloschistes cf. exilis]